MPGFLFKNADFRLAYSLALKLVAFQRTTWHCIPEDRTLHNHNCENLKPYIYFKSVSCFICFP
jgi:hypothetical protein